MASGAPLLKWEAMLAAQGTHLDQYHDKLDQNGTAPVTLEVTAPTAGFIQSCDARLIGEIIRELGGGRITKDSVIDYDVGVDSLAKPGEQVKSGGLLARIHGHSLKEVQMAANTLQNAFRIGPEKAMVPGRIAEVIDG
ncbi:Thymidine phosphorylase [bioreactor metagenome]|uniref:Thymidine phosphorylase n=1 Tax=bioreactor metagenome TaxID=1076179 RepID=A0A645FZ53_9ZZZZ